MVAELRASGFTPAGLGFYCGLSCLACLYIYIYTHIYVYVICMCNIYIYNIIYWGLFSQTVFIHIAYGAAGPNMV